MAVTVTLEDLRPFVPKIDQAKAEAMVQGAVARAAVVAPCLEDPAFPYEQAARSVIVGAIVRWDAAGAGNITAEAEGPYSVTREASQGLFRPSEVAELQALCLAFRAAAGGAWSAGPLYAMPPSPTEDPLYRRATTPYQPRVIPGDWTP